MTIEEKNKDLQLTY